MTTELQQLIDMSRKLGDPHADLVILGEGNTSVRAAGDTFWVKASGTELALAERSTFVRVRFAQIMAAMDSESLDDAAVKQLLSDATVEGDRSPSIETFLHALCLQLDGVAFVGELVGISQAEEDKNDDCDKDGAELPDDETSSQHGPLGTARSTQLSRAR